MVVENMIKEVGTEKFTSSQIRGIVKDLRT